MLVEKSIVDDIARLTLNRPSEQNVLSTDMLKELSKALVKLDKECKIVVLEGNGSSFCAGADMNELFESNSRRLKAFSILGKKVCAQLESLKVPTIAVLHGHTLGEGIELALSCDLRIASDKTTFEFPQVRLGYPPGFGATKKLPQLIGKPRALELLLTGAAFDAKTANILGLINQVVAHKQLEKSVDNLISLLVSHESEPLNAIKYLVNAQDLVKETAWFSEEASTPESKLKMKELLGED